MKLSFSFIYRFFFVQCCFLSSFYSFQDVGCSTKGLAYENLMCKFPSCIWFYLFYFLSFFFWFDIKRCTVSLPSRFVRLVFVSFCKWWKNYGDKIVGFLLRFCGSTLYWKTIKLGNIKHLILIEYIRFFFVFLSISNKVNDICFWHTETENHSTKKTPKGKKRQNKFSYLYVLNKDVTTG